MSNKPKLANCSPSDITKVLKKLGDFNITEGSNHTKVKHIATGKSSTVPRHNPVNKHLMRAFVKDYLVKELKYTEKDIYKVLWC